MCLGGTGIGGWGLVCVVVKSGHMLREGRARVAPLLGAPLRGGFGGGVGMLTRGAEPPLATIAHPVGMKAGRAPDVVSRRGPSAGSPRLGVLGKTVIRGRIEFPKSGPGANGRTPKSVDPFAGASFLSAQLRRAWPGVTSFPLPAWPFAPPVPSRLELPPPGSLRPPTDGVVPVAPPSSGSILAASSASMSPDCLASSKTRLAIVMRSSIPA